MDSWAARWRLRPCHREVAVPWPLRIITRPSGTPTASHSSESDGGDFRRRCQPRRWRVSRVLCFSIYHGAESGQLLPDDHSMKQPLKWPLYFKYLPDGELNLIGHCGRWHAGRCRAAMCRLPAAQSEIALKGSVACSAMISSLGNSNLSEFLLEIYRIEAMPGEELVEFRAIALRNPGGMRDIPSSRL